MPYALLFAAAVLPAVLLVWFFHARDTFPEPARVLWTTFALGCASIVPAVLAGVIVEPAMAATDLVSIAALQAFVVAALCEESSKLAVLLFYSFRRSEFDEPMDGIVYGATVSLGFAALENVLYVMNGGLAIAVLRGLLSVPGHATYGAVMGYYVGRARFDREHRVRLIGRGLLAAVMLHGFYNFPLMLMGDGGEPGTTKSDAAGAVSAEFLAAFLVVGLAAVIVGWTWSLVLVRRVRREQAGLAPPVLSPTGIRGGGPAPEGPASTAPAIFREPAAPGDLERRTVSPASAAWRRRGRLAGGWLAVLTGGGLASAGGLLAAAAVVFSVTGDVPPGDRLSLAVGITIVGVIPAVAGVALFAGGVRALNRGARSES